jgi:hypothetical protein
MPSIVQFAHPGAEHGPDEKNGNWKAWNTGTHRRKFLRCKGRYINPDESKQDGQLLFWGEWEPPSKVSEFRERPTPSYPRWLHEPVLPAKLPQSGGQQGNYQNTDPFVFGGRFIYFVCKQYIKKTDRTTSLAKLDKGSLILFGSTHGNSKPEAYFQLDTVFVVGDFIDYDVSDPEALSGIPGLETYRQIVYKMAFPSPAPKPIHLRLYYGATPESPISGMYSYSPAKIWDDDQHGFPRAPLRNRPFMTNNLNASPRSTKVSNELVIDNWKSIRKTTRDAGLVEGYGFQYQSGSSVPTVLSTIDLLPEKSSGFLCC